MNSYLTTLESGFEDYINKNDIYESQQLKRLLKRINEVKYFLSVLENQYEIETGGNLKKEAYASYPTAFLKTESILSF